MEKFPSVRMEVILSNEKKRVERWQAPFFEPPAAPESLQGAAELEVLAQARAYQDGKQEGLEAGRIEAREIISNLTGLLDEMAQPFRKLDDLVVHELVRTATRLAEKIVRRELSVSSKSISTVVAEAISVLYKLEGEIVVFLNPVDVAAILAAAPDSLDGKSWKVVEDPALSPGGCQVKTATSFVDASVEVQLESVFNRFIESTEKAAIS
jgi:flagellar assembly protein FliH